MIPSTPSSQRPLDNGHNLNLNSPLQKAKGSESLEKPIVVSQEAKRLQQRIADLTSNLAMMILFFRRGPEMPQMLRDLLPKTPSNIPQNLRTLKELGVQENIQEIAERKDFSFICTKAFFDTLSGHKLSKEELEKLASRIIDDEDQDPLYNNLGALGLGNLGKDKKFFTEAFPGEKGEQIYKEFKTHFLKELNNV